ncbi:hypothetical protein [Agrobacterium sp. NPDC089420]|uniref:hypothetical protein n=1 Tax=Agrobacterium sp. NPDC089420 TaxID=3363918 RepID=UPI00384D9552
MVVSLGGVTVLFVGGMVDCPLVTVDDPGFEACVTPEELGDGAVTPYPEGVSPSFEMPNRISPQSNQYRFFMKKPPWYIAEG